MFYSTISNSDYELCFANEDYLKGAYYDDWGLPVPGTVREINDTDYEWTHKWTTPYSTYPAMLPQSYGRDPSSFERLDVDACVDAYANTYMSDRRHVVLLSPWVEPHPMDMSVQSNSSLYYVKPSDNVNYLYNMLDRYGWLCNHNGRESPACTNSVAKEYAAQNWEIFGWPVSGCISETLQETCSVNFHLGIAIAVVLANLGKTLCIAAVCLLLMDQPLLTTGDAVASFMNAPDRTTEGCCLLDRHDIQTRWTSLLRAQKSLPPKVYMLQTHRRWRAVGWKSWLSFLLL